MTSLRTSITDKNRPHLKKSSRRNFTSEAAAAATAFCLWSVLVTVRTLTTGSDTPPSVHACVSSLREMRFRPTLHYFTYISTIQPNETYYIFPSQPRILAINQCFTCFPRPHSCLNQNLANILHVSLFRCMNTYFTSETLMHLSNIQSLRRRSDSGSFKLSYCMSSPSEGRNARSISATGVAQRLLGA